MTKTTKIVTGIIIILALTWLVVARQNKPSEQPTTIKIGAILPLSGDFAPFGEEINRGAIIAAEEARRESIAIEYFPEDDKSQATDTANAANKLINITKVDAALTATVQEIKPAAPIFNSSNTPILAVWDSNNFIKSAGPNIFTIGFSTEAAGQQMANFAKNKLKLSKVAIFPVQDEWSKLIAQAFAEKFEALGGKITRQEEVLPNQKDFRTLISKSKNDQADGIYAPLLPTAGGVFAKQVHELNYEGIVMMGDSFSADDVKTAGGAAEGIYLTNLYADNTKLPVEKYKVKFGQEPADPVFVSFGYDGMKTLIAAVKNC